MTGYSRATRDDLAAVVDFISPLNVEDDHRIGYLGDNPEEIRQELLEFGAIDYALLAREQGDLVGFMAMDVDEELERCYLLGPFVDLENWHEIANRLVAECLAIVPDKATEQLEMFFDRSNENASRLGRSLGFETYKDVRTLRFDRCDLRIKPGSAIPVESRHHAGLVKLHDRTFPNTHLPGARMLEGLGDNRACFVRTDSEDVVVGYVYAEVDNTTGSATLEFVGTAEHARGRGIGADLVQTGLSWMFGFESVSETWLVVDEDNLGAQKLYERMGWTKVHRLTSMRRWGRPGTSHPAVRAR